MITACGDGQDLDTLAVDPASLTLEVGDTATLTAVLERDGVATPLTADVTWTSSNLTAVSVTTGADGRGQVTALAPGVATVRAIHGDEHALATVNVIGAAPEAIEIEPENPSLPVGVELQLAAMVSFSDDSRRDLSDMVTWASDDEAVATVSDAGLLVGLAPGTVEISASLSGLTATTTVTVTDAELLAIEVTPDDAVLFIEDTLQLTATGVYSDESTQNLTAQVTWASSDPEVATVSNEPGSEGLAEAVDAGSVSVTATLGDISGEVTLNVSSAELVSIEITPDEVSLELGLTVQLVATGTYSDESTQNITAQVAWASSDEEVATVSDEAGSQGRVSTHAMGTATITAILREITGTATIHVTEPCDVTINEVRTRSPMSSSDEFVELYNGCSQDIDLAGSRLVYRAAAGTNDVILINFTESTVLAPGDFRVYHGVNYTGPGDGDWGGGTGGRLALNGGGVALRDAEGAIRDSVGYGTATNEFVEGTAAPAPATGLSISRQPHDGADSDDNAVDFVESESTPRASNH